MHRINPNYVTALRLFLCMPLACVFIANGWFECALATMAFAEFTDWADGFIARRTDQVSDLGKMFDPLCDTVFHMTVWISLLSIHLVPLFCVVIFSSRDSIGSAIRSRLAKEGIVLAARLSGKAKSFSQATAQIVVVAGCIFPLGRTVQMVAMLVAVVVTICSLVDYCLCAARVLKRSLVKADASVSSKAVAVLAV